MAFQDFDRVAERPRAERQRKLRKRINIGAVLAVTVVVIIAVGVFEVVSHSRHGSSKLAQPRRAVNELSFISDTVIKSICRSAGYKEMCVNTLTRAARAQPGLSQPKDLLKIAITATGDEIENAMNKIIAFELNTAAEKSAFEDCKELMQDAKEELAVSTSQLAYHGLEKLSSRIPDDLNNCLSAVMSYQQTCIDGFPEGKLKDDTEKALQPCKELASNSLAMVSEVSSLLSRILVPGFGRRLLANESNSPILEKDGLPTWMTHDHRSMFKLAQVDNPQPNVTVAKHGTGDYETITEALANMPKLFEGRYVIYVKEGIYEENVTITKKMQNVTMYGDGSQKSIITGSRNFVDGVRTFQTATFAALGDNFLAKSMGFRNTAGPEKHQAVACRVQADRSAFLNCRFEGYQDTLYVQTHRQFYRGCVIAGTIDFIFGDAAVVIQNCMILVRQPMENQQNIVTAQGRIDKRETTGIVLQSCRILADKTLESAQSKMIRSYLGRPWKEYSRTIVMESIIADIIHPDGWMAWDGDFALETLYYAEFNNTGAGANVDARVKWHGYSVMNKEEATEYTVGPFLQGESWIPALGVPVHFGLYY